MTDPTEGVLRQARRLHSERCLAVLSLAIGTTLGLVIGFNRRLDATMMRVMDGLMALPAILLALALMALMRGSVRNVIVALVVPQIPVIVRLVRASVLSLREAVMVEGARALGVRTPRILLRYILPALVAPLIVQGTYICASAMLVEAYLSFLGAGTPPHIPSWGNIMARPHAGIRGRLASSFSRIQGSAVPRSGVSKA